MSDNLNPFQINPYYHTILGALEETSWLRLIFNNVPMFLPVGTVLTMAHCLPDPSNDPLILRVETAHLEWLMSKLKPGSVFLDVGAATGAMTVPIAMNKPDIEVIALEPAARARRFLEATLVKNGVFGVKIAAVAVSNRNGTETFYELKLSENGAIPFLPEASTLSSEVAAHYPHEKFTIETVTFDSIGERYGLVNRHLVIKLDIEGYEELALETATNLFAYNSAHIAIDIHASPTGIGDTRKRCEDLLISYGFEEFGSMGHVLLARRKSRTCAT